MKRAIPTCALRRAAQRGVTLIEVMVVVIILGILAGGVAAAVFPQLLKAKIQEARIGAKEMRRAAGLWRSDHAADSCPTPSQLREAGLLDDGSKLTDPWGTPFQIACPDARTIVLSLGPDRKESDDDIVEPDPVAMAP